jgi:hypothetical protein
MIGTYSMHITFRITRPMKSIEELNPQRVPTHPIFCFRTHGGRAKEIGSGINLHNTLFGTGGLEPKGLSWPEVQTTLSWRISSETRMPEATCFVCGWQSGWRRLF